MTREEKPCLLCIKKRPLRKSHLIPKALFRMCRSTKAVNPNPIAMGDGLPHATSYQPVCGLLCSECEQMLSRNGEAYVIGNCCRPDGKFRIREILCKSSPAQMIEGDPFYIGSQVPGLNVNALRFYAASILWRASVAVWHPPAGKTLQNPLGKYEENFRQFLLDVTPLEAVRFLIYLSAEADPPRMVTFPMSVRQEGHHAHWFYIPGLLFFVLVGQIFPDYIASRFVANKNELPIIFSDTRNSGFYKRTMRDINRGHHVYRSLVAKLGGQTK